MSQSNQPGKLMNWITFSVDKTNPFYDQMCMYVLSLAGMAGSLNLFITLEHIIRRDVKNEKLGIVPKLAINDMPLKVSTHNVHTVVLNIKDWINYQGGYTENRPDTLEFKTCFNSKVEENGLPKHSHSIMKEASFIPVQITCNAIGMSYESQKLNLISALGKNPIEWSPDLQFFRHARNACFHNNTYNIRNHKNKLAIDPNNPPAWRDFTIPDQTINGREFANKHFPYNMTLPFLAEMGQIIKQLTEH